MKVSPEMERKVLEMAGLLELPAESQPPPIDIPEADFQVKVVAFARENGWLAFHTFDSRRSEPGFLDCHFLRGPRQVVAELKTRTGKLTAAQKKWLNAYRKAGVPAYVWRPESWSEIKQVLGEVR